MPAVTILGRGDDWRECPFQNSEIWGSLTCLLSPDLRDQAFTKVFAFDGKNFPEIDRALPIARDRNIPVVSTLDYATEQYPLRDVAREFRTSYLKNTISYMLAYAALLRYDKINLYGIGGRQRWDYEQNKPFITFWLGIAFGRGIDVRIGAGSWKWICGVAPHTDLTADAMERWHEAVAV